MTLLSASSLVAPWVVLPLAGVVLLITAAHVASQQRADVPAKRRRLRTASGLLMMLVTTLLAWALAVQPVPESAASPAARHEFALMWLLILGLTVLVVLLALMDAVHTLRLGLEARRALRREAAAQGHQEFRRD